MRTRALILSMAVILNATLGFAGELKNPVSIAHVEDVRTFDPETGGISSRTQLVSDGSEASIEFLGNANEKTPTNSLGMRDGRPPNIVNFVIRFDDYLDAGTFKEALEAASDRYEFIVSTYNDKWIGKTETCRQNHIERLALVKATASAVCNGFQIRDLETGQSLSVLDFVNQYRAQKRRKAELSGHYDGYGLSGLYDELMDRLHHRGIFGDPRVADQMNSGKTDAPAAAGAAGSARSSAGGVY